MPQTCIPVNKTDQYSLSHCLLYLFHTHQYSSYCIRARHCVKCFTNINSCIPLNNLVRQALLLPQQTQTRTQRFDTRLRSAFTVPSRGAELRGTNQILLLQQSWS